MKNRETKKLTPMMLATALVTISSSAIAYDHNNQSSIINDKDFQTPYKTIQDNTFTQTVNPQTGMIYSDHD